MIRWRFFAWLKSWLAQPLCVPAFDPDLDEGCVASPVDSAEAVLFALMRPDQRVEKQILARKPPTRGTKPADSWREEGRRSPHGVPANRSLYGPGVHSLQEAWRSIGKKSVRFKSWWSAMKDGAPRAQASVTSAWRRGGHLVSPASTWRIHSSPSKVLPGAMNSAAKMLLEQPSDFTFSPEIQTSELQSKAKSSAKRPSRPWPEIRTGHWLHLGPHLATTLNQATHRP